MNHLTEFQQRAAGAGLAKLLAGDNFYTSDVRKLAELLQRPLGGPDWMAMEPLHCMKWGDMDPDLRRMLREKVLELLGLPPDIIDMVDDSPKTDEKPGKTSTRLRLAFWK
jgi:hypothetical protein